MSAMFCQLCGRSEETTATGRLLTDSDVCAHLECMLYSSNLWCQNSPGLDDLNGFAVEDVRKEVQRGKHLLCHKCKKPGATVGCELRRCRRSYHYPCALEDGAEHTHDEEMETYNSLYCPKHKGKPDKGDASFSDTPKTYCFKCEALKGNPAMEGGSGAHMVPCSDHTPAAEPTADSDSDDGPSNTVVSQGRKRKLTFTEEWREEEPSERKRKSCSDSDESEELALPLSSDAAGTPRSPSGEVLQCDAETQYEGETIIDPHVKVESLLAPLEFSPPTSPVPYLKEEPLDEEEEAMMEARSSEKREKAVPAEESRNPRVRLHQQFLATYRRKDKGQAASGTAKQQGDGYAEPPEAESIIPSDVDSDSLLAPVRTRDGLQGRSASQVGSMETENGVSRAQSRLTDPVDMPEYYRYAGAGLFSSPVSPTPLDSNGAAIMDASSFWKSCNAAGCTEDFFTDLVSEMSRLSQRIQSDQASQEDYDVAMKVMEASGRLALLVDKKQKELEEKQAALTRAQAAMKTLASAVRR
ncbi:uncharacterized protein phf11 isoform 1-T1 [Synchiropus picturatus]